MTNAEAWFNKSLRPRKPEGSLGRTAQDGHLDSHTAPELYLQREMELGFYSELDCLLLQVPTADLSDSVFVTLFCTPVE